MILYSYMDADSHVYNTFLPHGFAIHFRNIACIVFLYSVDIMLYDLCWLFAIMCMIRANGCVKNLV